MRLFTYGCYCTSTQTNSMNTQYITDIVGPTSLADHIIQNDERIASKAYTYSFQLPRL